MKRVISTFFLIILFTTGAETEMSKEQSCLKLLGAGMYNMILEDICGFNGGVKDNLKELYTKKGCRILIPQEKIDQMSKDIVIDTKKRYKTMGLKEFCNGNKKAYYALVMPSNLPKSKTNNRHNKNPKIGSSLKGGVFIYREAVEIYWNDWIVYPLIDKKELPSSGQVDLTISGEGKTASFNGMISINCENGKYFWHNAKSEADIDSIVPIQVINNSINLFCKETIRDKSHNNTNSHTDTDNKIIVSDEYYGAGIYMKDYIIRSKSEECSITYETIDNYLVGTTCLSLTNSKGIKIFCTKNKKICKTEKEVMNAFNNMYLSQFKQYPEVQSPNKVTSRDTGMHEVTTIELNVRDNPSQESNILGTVKRGDKVDVYEFSGKWAHTKYGWISGKYLQLIQTTRKSTLTNTYSPQPINTPTAVLNEVRIADKALPCDESMDKFMKYVMSQPKPTAWKTISTQEGLMEHQYQIGITFIEKKMGYSYDKTVRSMINQECNHPVGVMLIIPIYMDIEYGTKYGLKKGYVTQQTYDLVMSTK